MKDVIIKKLKAKGMKLTPQRLAVIEAFAENALLHPSANIIYEEARKKRPGISLSTIYYTLNELAKNGIITILEFEKMDNRHEGNTKSHIHLICKECNKIIDIFPKFFDPSEIIKNVDFLVTAARFEYYGYCPECLEQKTPSKTGNSLKMTAYRK